ncbi:hypothetical protein [Streptomyces sp. NPDC055189]
MSRPGSRGPSTLALATKGSAWPFAITRSVDTGFHIVVAPDFLIACNLHHLLSDVASGEAAEATAYLREYQDRGHRGLWVLYRVGYLRGSHLGSDADYVLHGGRRTPLVEGIVCVERPGPPTDDLFDWVHGICAEPVRAFFTADSDTHPVCPSAGAEPPATGTALHMIEAGPYHSERNLQVALTGHRPPPSRPAHGSTERIPSGRSEDVADPGAGPGRDGRVDAGCCTDARCAQRLRQARRLALAATVAALGLATALIVALLR